MLTKIFKLSLVVLFATSIIFFSPTRAIVHANLNGPPAARTGAPSELTCAISGCHDTSALNSGSGSVTISGLPDSYTAGQDYNVTVTVALPGRTRFGFQATVIDDQGRAAGTLTATDATRTQIISGTVGGNSRRYIEHRSNGTTSGTFTFRWTAPATSVGRVTCYAAGNAANGNFDSDGDNIYTTSKSVQATAAPAAVTTISAASYSPSGTLAGNSIGALFGTNLAGGVAVAATNPLPATLNGVTVKVKDATGTERDASLIFVSPAQINLIIPGGTSNGTATMTVVRDGATVGVGTITVDTIATGLFSANSQGNGTAAAEVLRVKADGTLVYEPLARINTAGVAEAIPVVFGPADEQLFLILYGTGFRANPSVTSATCTIGGENAEVLYANNQNILAGLDQANVRLPRTLAGRGTLNIILTVVGKSSNTVTVTMQ